MYILRVVIFSLDEPNLTRILTVFKENLVKCKGKRTSREYTFILFLILSLMRTYCVYGYVRKPNLLTTGLKIHRSPLNSPKPLTPSCTILFFKSSIRICATWSPPYMPRAATP